MTLEYVPGRPHKLTPEKEEIILREVRKNISITNAARCAAVDPWTIKHWMEAGYGDHKKHEDTIFAQFFRKIVVAQGERISEMLQIIAGRPTNWQALAWLLEKCCAEDFGKDSELYKQLLEDYKRLIQEMIDSGKKAAKG